MLNVDFVRTVTENIYRSDGTTFKTIETFTATEFPLRNVYKSAVHGFSTRFDRIEKIRMVRPGSTRKNCQFIIVLYDTAWGYTRLISVRSQKRTPVQGGGYPYQNGRASNQETGTGIYSRVLSIRVDCGANVRGRAARPRGTKVTLRDARRGVNLLPPPPEHSLARWCRRVPSASAPFGNAARRRVNNAFDTVLVEYKSILLFDVCKSKKRVVWQFDACRTVPVGLKWNKVRRT